MKYDEDGVVCGLDPVEHIKEFLSQEESTRYLEELKSTLIWTEISWTGQGTIPRLIYYYQELDRQTRRQNILEELILQIEEVFETSVARVECSWYRKGEDHRAPHQDFKGKHVFILSLGYPRKTVVKKQNSPEGKVFNMCSGDLLYISSKANREYEHCCTRDTRISESQMELVFFTDSPYINRSQHLRYIEVLGVGKIPVWFQGSSQEWTKDLTAAILPASFHQLIGATFNHPIEDSFHPVEVSLEVV